MKKSHYTIGTRGSLLALTQCLQVKEELEKTTGHTFSLKVIKTQGDENTQAPLWQLEGKDFFTKELDQALLQEEIDLVVHSYKDLGSERPEGIQLAAVTQRKFPHDILLINKSVVEDLKQKRKTEILVGTSSPRRIVNMEDALAQYLPFGNLVTVKTESLRGNVNTRIEKLKSGAYDAIVLALPGIERLAQGLPNEDNIAFEKFGNPREILKGLLQDLDFMILPTSTFPAAASQGALGLECLSKNSEMLEILSTLNHERTIEEVKHERKRFQEFGGGCHLAVGITARSTEAGIRQSLKGKVDDREINELSLLKERPQKKLTSIFIGLEEVTTFEQEFAPHFQIIKESVLKKTPLESTAINVQQDLLITGPSALQYYGPHLKKNRSLWASGTKTMRELAKKGHWVHGCADSLGEEEVATLRDSEVLSLMLGKSLWLSITNQEARSTLGETLPVYEKKVSSDGDICSIKDCDLYYWTSPSQYDYYRENFSLNPDALHCTGLGKTYQRVKEERNIMPFTSMAEFKDYLRKQL